MIEIADCRFLRLRGSARSARARFAAGAGEGRRRWRTAGGVHRWAAWEGVGDGADRWCQFDTFCG